MSAIGMMGANVLEALLSRTSSSQNQSHKFKQDFQQLGQDLQSGNVTRGQADLAALQSDLSTQPSSSASPNLASQTLNQLAQDLQTGNLTAAQSDVATLQQNMQQGAGHGQHHHAHVSASSNGLAQLQQSFSELGQALQSGNLSSAQQAYAAIQADTAALAPLGSSNSYNASSPAIAGMSVSA